MSSIGDRDDDLHSQTQSDRYKNLSSRKVSRADSLEIESHGVVGNQSRENKADNWSVILNLAFQSIGVVYGDIGTSPLYTIPGVFPNGIKNEEDIYGALSIIFYTLTLLPLIKYVCIVLRANDNGDGGTFALYSLLCRHAKVGLIPSQEAEDREVSTFNLELPNNRLRRSSKLKSMLENCQCAKFILLIATMLGTSMVIGDGILTPCISVLSAVAGIKIAAPSITQEEVIWISVVILIGLFMVQRFGTDKIGYSFAPILTLWFICIALIGVYNWLKWDIAMIKAINPYYIFKYFKRNKKEAWLSLGGTILCVTGAEALFADLGHFRVKSIVISMTTLVYPCLIFAYLGQCAYLIKHTDEVTTIFFNSIPDSLYWPMFVIAILAAIIASQSLISGVFAIIQQSLSLGCFPRVKVIHTSAKYEGQVYIPEANYLLMFLCVLVTLTFRDTVALGNAYGIAVVFVMTLTSAFLVLIMILVWKTNIILILVYVLVIGSVELIYLSALLYKFPQGGYLPLAFSFILMSVMYIWNDVYRRKYYYELKNKISPKEVKDTIVHTSTQRIPGLAIFYSELVHGIPPIFKHYVANIPALHDVLVFVSFKSLHTSKVPREQRFLFRRVQPSELNVFRCVVRYGYKETRYDEEPFEMMLVEGLKHFIKDDYKFSAVIQNGPTETDTDTYTNTDVHDNKHEKEAMEREIEKMDKAWHAGIIHLVGENDVIASKGAGLWKRIMINYAYNFIRRNLSQGEKVLDIPHERLVKVGMTYEL